MKIFEDYFFSDYNFFRFSFFSIFISLDFNFFRFSFFSIFICLDFHFFYFFKIFIFFDFHFTHDDESAGRVDVVFPNQFRPVPEPERVGGVHNEPRDGHAEAEDEAFTDAAVARLHQIDVVPAARKPGTGMTNRTCFIQ